jgi:hypothetical protein
MTAPSKANVPARTRACKVSVPVALPVNPVWFCGATSRPPHTTQAPPLARRERA